MLKGPQNSIIKTIMDKQKAVIYIRVSDPSQIENNSLETQLKTCQGYAERNNWEVVEIFKEKGVSAKTVHNRPEMRRLLAYCTNRKNKVSQAIVYKMDRFARNTEDGLVAISLLAKHGAFLVSATEATEETPMGRAMRTILMTLAQLDNELKGERVKDNMQTMFRNGIWPFKCPPGYYRPGKDRHEKRGKAPEIEPTSSQIIGLLFNKASSGRYPKKYLADFVNGLGYKKHFGKSADGETVKQIIGNSFYHGYMYVNKWNEYHWGNHKRLIEKEEWEKAFYNTLGTKRMFKHQDSELFPLKGTLRCAICNHPMTSSNPKGRTKHYLSYECHQKDCVKQERIGNEHAHQQFLDILTSLRPSKRVIRLFCEMVFNEWDNSIANLKKEAELKEKQIGNLENELTGIALSNSKGILNDEEAKQRADKIRNDIVVLKIERSDVKIDEYDTETVKAFTETFLTNTDRLWRELELPQKQALQNLIFPKGVVCQDKNIRTTTLSQSFEIIEALQTSNSDFVSPEGFEPSTFSLRGNCSTIELWAQNFFVGVPRFELGTSSSQTRRSTD